MPKYDVDCPACGEREVFHTSHARSVRGCEPGHINCECGAQGKKLWRSGPVVQVFGNMKRVDGLPGEYSSYREVEKAAEAVGRRIETEEEKRARIEEARKASVEYAESIGFGSRQEYAEARRTRGEEMVAEARDKYMDRQRGKYGGAFVDEAIGDVNSDKWRSGLSSPTSKT